jgi:hypothetical protein
VDLTIPKVYLIENTGASNLDKVVLKDHLGQRLLSSELKEEDKHTGWFVIPGNGSPDLTGKVSINTPSAMCNTCTNSDGVSSLFEAPSDVHCHDCYTCSRGWCCGVCH